ncbi:5378_t:CDS:1, partial [Cetraspora pellucida]
MFIDQKKHFLASSKKDKVAINEFANSDNENNLTIINLLITKYKGRPETK